MSGLAYKKLFCRAEKNTKKIFERELHTHFKLNHDIEKHKSSDIKKIITDDLLSGVLTESSAMIGNCFMIVREASHQGQVLFLAFLKRVAIFSL